MRHGILLICLALLTAGHAMAADPVVGFDGYADAPPFTLAPRDTPLPAPPCSLCHQHLPVNTTPRQLPPPHPVLAHGKGRMWCLSCHDADNRDQLHDFLGGAVAFDDAYLVCGQCHYARQRDWYYGAHGKRVGNWQGERVLLNCTRCHNPHDPAIKPRPAQAPPPVRVGLQRQEAVADEHAPAWERSPADPARETTDEQQ